MILSIVLVAAIVAVVISFLRFHARQADNWQKERQLLLTRIQHPEVVQVERAPVEPLPEPEPDERDYAGSVIPE